MPRLAITPAPGISRHATPDASGGWWDMSQVRWRGSELQPIGGWAALNMKLTGPVRSILSWRDNTAERWVAAASLGQILVYDSAGHDITPAGFVAGTAADLIAGWGIGIYGAGLYGTPRQPDIAFNPRGSPGDTVTLDNWGQNLVVTGSADGRILWWVPDAAVSTKLVPIPPAAATPSEGAITHVVPPARAAIVTDERFLMAIGANHDPRQVAWSDQERPGAWTPAIANLCGSLQLKSTGAALAARRIAQGIMIWCDDDVHLASYVGPPYGYGINRVGTGCGPISPQSMVALTGRTVWMGQQSFFIFEGVPLPLKCPIEDFIFRNMNRATQGRTVAAHSGVFPEIWWFYPDEAGTDPNRYVVWNYELNIWYTGALARTGINEPNAYGVPLMGDAQGYVYGHEEGMLANGAERGPADVYAETSTIALGQGDQGVCVRSIIPDLANPEQAQLHFFGQWEPEAPLEDYGVFAQTRKDGRIDALFEARAVRLRIESVPQATAALTLPWVLGKLRLDVVAGSGR